MKGLFSKKSDSKDIALERLGRVLLRDRADLKSTLSADMLRSLGNDILLTISNYMEFDKNNTEIHIETDDPQEGPVLYVRVPIVKLFKESQVN